MFNRSSSNFFLTFIWIIFPLGAIGKESQGKDPELLSVAITRQHWKFPCCSVKRRLLRLLRWAAASVDAHIAKKAKEGSAELIPRGLCTGEQALQQLEVQQQQLNSQKRNASRKPSCLCPHEREIQESDAASQTVQPDALARAGITS